MKFFGPFRVLYFVSKQAWKLEILRKYRIYDYFHILLLEQDPIRKKRIDKNNMAELDAGKGEGGEYKL